MSAIENPQPGDRVVTPDGRFRECVPLVYGETVRHSGSVHYISRDGGPVRECWITTWRDWCRKHRATPA